MRPEILAPAGTPKALEAAVKAGADAIYLGGSLFSARAFAGNFDQEELLKAIAYCHLFDVKLYLAVNTLMKETEIAELPSYIAPFYEAGVDGIIVQDVGCAKVLHETFPDLLLHASTQMSITSEYGAKLLKEYGFKRIVPARELSLSELKEIKEKTQMEIETFVHGAMCFCYSGKCLLSSFAGGRSGNRGRCAQPCRKCYEVSGTTEYAMSLKDMCTLSILPDLIDAGIDSFKIEGRMKNPVYVASAVGAYRKVRDYYLDLQEKRDPDLAEKYAQFVRPLEKELMDIYNRGGFSDGYYQIEKSYRMLAADRPNHTGLRIGQVKRIAPPQVEILLEEDVNAQDVLEIRAADVELTSPVSARAGEVLSLKGKQFRSIKEGQEVFRTRNNALIDRIQQDVINPEKQIPVTGVITARIGKPLVITIKGKETICVEGDLCQKAEAKPTMADELIQKLQKTGNTPIGFEAIESDVEDNVFVPMSAFNHLRRDAMEAYQKKVIDRYRRGIS
ncbi:MAG: U32 family peptidase [Lachnospiraceae bacterium]|nr:U32 family peptidase [Lachnospiraceae bacterium]